MSFIDFLKEENGQLSSMRIGYLLWAIGVFGVWAACSIQSGTLQPIPDSVLVALGIMQTGKTTSKFGESKAQ